MTVSRPRRVVRVVSYVMMAAAGGLSFAIPVSSIEATTGGLVYFWAAFLLLGGILSAWGSTTDRWIGELLGLPLIFTANAVYFVVLGLAFTVRGAVASLVLGGFAMSQFARWQDVSTIRQEADRAAHPGPREVT